LLLAEVPVGIHILGLVVLVDIELLHWQYQQVQLTPLQLEVVVVSRVIPTLLVDKDHHQHLLV
jgi:hypothetical protein